MSIRTAIVRRPIDVAALLDEVASTANGATVVFLGHVREVNDGRAVTGIEYSAYGEMAERELASITGECAATFGITHLVAEHRLGELALGDASIAIVVAHPHRAAAYEASRFVIEQVKERLPVWKREGYVDGTSEWVNAGGVSQGAAAPEQRMIAGAQDQFGRRIEYLRISVTDRCNFRCAYCMPLEGLPWLPREDILSYEEITEVVRQLAPLGVSRLRITGGEPTIRPQLTTLVSMLKALPGIQDIALSTNGVKLPEMAASLKEAGLDRVNMSADSLRPDRIREIARRSLRFSPIDAAMAAERAGLGPVKINTVVMRGINDDELENFARLTLEHAWHVRFIELMPVGEMADATFDRVVPSDEILERLSRVAPLAPDAGPARGNGPAAYYRFAGAPGSIGVITPMSHTYCGDCNRVRLTADGRLRTCLYGEEEVSFRDALRAGEPLAPLYASALANKPREHALLQMKVGGLRALSQVGG